MRLHRLRMTAFGPFAADTEIDFDALGADGLFLLHGQTGAGKTSVLDAVAFALFGRVPGTRQEGRRLHSDHADAQQVPEVELEATIGGRRMRIVRAPEYHRPKKRGTGTTKVQAKATMTWLDDSGPALTRLPEIGESITRLLGMSADQFFQVVLLPQGDFARFLRASSEDREALLERLFDTERFGGVEEWLKDRARQAEAALGEKAAAVERIAGQMAAVLDCEPPTEAEIDWAQGCLANARETVESAHRRLTAAQAELDGAQTTLANGNRLAELRRRGLEAQARLTQLDAGAADLEQARVAARAARAAAPIIPLADDHDAAASAATTASRAYDSAAAGFADLPEGAALVGPDSDLDVAIERWTGESARWEPLARRVEQRPTLLTDLRRLDAEVAAAQARTAELTDMLEAAPDRRQAAVTALTAASEARSDVQRLAADRERCEELVASFVARQALDAELMQARTEVLTARESHTAAREHHLDLRERRIAGMAAELASTLAQGEPCMVCGSTEHPAPADAGEQTDVAKTAEAAAAAAEDRAAARRGRAETALATLEARRAHLDEEIGEESADAVRSRRQVLDRELADARTRVASIPTLERAVNAIDAEIETWRTELGRLVASTSARAERRSSLRREIDDLDAEVAQATGGRIGVDERRAELAELCRRARALRDARADLHRAVRHRDDLAGRLELRLSEAGFSDVGALRAAAATPTQLDAWETMVARAGELRAGAQETMADADVAAAVSTEPVDIGVLSEALALAQRRQEAAAREHALAARTVTRLEELVAEFWSALDVLAPARERHARVQGLADLVAGRGQNARKMSLHSYVLASRLEEVLVAASVRLHQMSSGRYEFVHSDAAGPRGRRGGLGIEVHDEYTGAVRAATTLSGGETFFASLALALGLADVVSTESGGRVLDTIFIDEGFGSLDPEALDLVMGVLDELRSGGRVVGVVSHVDEMRARIPAQLHVMRGTNGSSVRMDGVVGVS
ncbi:SMC family ATPase [Gordonia sp. L191]|uniref:AAA family ATPase n=1 Tax=Gordonia sp. L191 TaxID=2982699 RepID=UPI0024BFB6B6|nr:SMC family ATPase [Gordonia sp. L191]WHU45279.1 SMC family ATPase [Gordonia sp. L191]